MKCLYAKKNVVHLSLIIMVVALSVPSLATADVKVFEKDNLSVKLYGQVNRAILYANDGNNDNFYNVDNDNSSTRIGIKAAVKVNKTFTVGSRMEYEYQSNPSNKVWQDETNTSDDKFDKRILDIYLQSEKYGKLTLGHGSTASDSSTEIDLSGTKVATYVRVSAMAGGIHFYDDATKSLSDVNINSVFNNLDGDARKDRIRYDTPSLAGFSLAVSTVFENGDDDRDIALRYKKKLGTVKVSGGISYVDFGSSASKKNQLSGSLSFLMDNGFNVTIAGGNLNHESAGRDDANYYYGKIGYIAHIFSLGTTAFAADYGKYKNMGTNDDDADTVGVMAVQKFKEWNTELYLAYRNYKLDRVGTNYDNIDAVMAGFRFKF